ncbi:hypothetical protein [Mycobacterium sp. Aquia_213]|uniref:hypothetical protein n=1 Tax=Mycobacterium sp. Aquia_213 TaxID=2991728 RepID=UPI00226F742B|nr:hypothetical protein [Mycobacterium sp. Aquia_213]WAC93387.1 hypothetical protein LMQ14_09775 [Mycobacterium sp. Aquia_213]
MTHRIIAGIAACALFAGVPHADADTGVALPPVTSTGSGPIIGGADAEAQGRYSRQFVDLGKPDVQQVDGSDAGTFIAAAAGVTDRQLAAPFSLLQQALSCQKDTSGIGARAYRRNDGHWGGAMLVMAKSATQDVDQLAGCVRSTWRAAAAGTPTMMCDSGWTYPTSGENHRPETYYILLAGTDSDFCGTFDGNYRNYATVWP